jgi:hypothetical protein
MSSSAVSVGSDSDGGHTAAAIQRAVDGVAASGGGTVELPGQVFDIEGPVRLRSGVTLVGQGSATVLRKRPSVSSSVVDWIGYGHFEVTVRDPDLFEPGMGVTVCDRNALGFYATVGKVTGRDGSALFIDTMLNHDYVPADGARVVSVFPLICADAAEDVGIADLVIDGASDPEHLGGCRGGGVFLLRTHGATVEGVEVTNYNGDAVSFQQCTDVVVRGCDLHDNTGGGIHPGSGSVRYLLSGNRVHDNGADGVFYCLRTTHSLCEGNEIRGNARVGISIGERDTDHIISANEIRGNGGAGVLFRDVRYHGGDRVRLEGNRIGGNGSGAEAQVVIAPGIRDVTLQANSFEAMAGHALRIGEGVARIHVAANTCDGRPLAYDDVDDASGCVVWAEPGSPLDMGPTAATAAHTRHLAFDLPSEPPNAVL